MDFDSRIVSIIAVVLIMSLGYFVYLIYNDVLAIKTEFEELKTNLLLGDYEEDEEDEEELMDEDEHEEYDDQDEGQEFEKELDDLFTAAPVPVPVVIALPSNQPPIVIDPSKAIEIPGPVEEPFEPEEKELGATSKKGKKQRKAKSASDI